MARPGAPSLPTPKQIADTFKSAKELCPGARISRVGPDGVHFTYDKNEADDWGDKPFTGG